MNNQKLETETAKVLGELGFKGKCLRDLQAIILCEKDFEDFKNFIILNDKKLKSQLQIVHQYKLHLKSKNDSYNTSSFYKDFKNCKSKEEKRKLLEKLTGTHVSMQMLHIILYCMEEKVFSLSQFCDILDKYGESYTLETILNMVESSKKNLAIMFKKAKSLSTKLLVVGFSAKVLPSVVGGTMSLLA